MLYTETTWLDWYIMLDVYVHESNIFYSIYIWYITLKTYTFLLYLNVRHIEYT